MRRPSLYRRLRNRFRHLGVELGGSAIIVIAVLVALLASEYGPWTTDQELGVLLIASILGVMMQAYVEFRLYFSMKSRRDRSQVGVGLKAKWWSLGWKNVFLSIRDILLFILVVFELDVRFPYIIAIVAATTTSTVIAGLIGNWLISRLQKEEEKLPNVGGAPWTHR